MSGDGVAADELAGPVHRAEEVGLLARFPGGGAAASCWSITPALRSASTAICLPGIPSRVNRAATSLMRVAPLVITTNWIKTMIEKMISPTTILSAPVAPLPVTNSPKVRTTPPAASRPSAPARVRISRVVATFNTSRKSVVASNERGEDVELQRRADVERRQQHNHRNGDVGGQQHVHHPSRHRDHDHQHAGDHGDGKDQVLNTGPDAGRGSARDGSRRHPCLQ